MMRMLAVLSLCAFLFMSCGGMSEDEIWSKANAGKDKSNAKERLQYCSMLVEKYPKSAHVPDALWKAATISSDELREYGSAVQYYREFFRRYPDRPDAPKALFLTAFLYNNELQNVDSARYYYLEFQRLYPANELAASARYELDNLGKPPEALIDSPAPGKIATKRR